MSILFGSIYDNAISLFDDPRIVKAYFTNKIQFQKLMYTYLQNAIGMFTNPASVGIRLSAFNPPVGVLETFEADGVSRVFELDSEFKILDNSLFSFIENGSIVTGKLDKANRTVTFPDVLPEGQEYAFEAYYAGEFLDDFTNLNRNTSAGNNLIIEEIKGILARLLVKSWAESERNELLDIRNIMQDSDFKLTGNDKILKTKNQWIDQLDSEILQLQNKLAWNIRFMNGSTNIGRG